MSEVDWVFMFVFFDCWVILFGVKESYWIVFDGVMVCWIDWLVFLGLCGLLLFLLGWGDVYEKYLEMFDYWYCCGWCVIVLDWCG